MRSSSDGSMLSLNNALRLACCSMHRALIRRVEERIIPPDKCQDVEKQIPMLFYECAFHRSTEPQTRVTVACPNLRKRLVHCLAVSPTRSTSAAHGMLLSLLTASTVSPYRDRGPGGNDGETG